MPNRFSALLVAGLALGATAFAEPAVVDLSGEWGFRTDPDNAGILQNWAANEFTDKTKLPGSMDEHSYGKTVTAVSLEHLNRLHEYTGAAWYQKDVEIPKTWRGKHIVLFLERCHWESRLWVDGKEIGMHDSLATPHEYDLSKCLAPGKHRLALRIDNTRKYTIGDWSHSITEETQTNWNGAIGRIELIASDPIFIESVKVFPETADKRACARVSIANVSGKTRTAFLRLGVARDGAALPAPAALKVVVGQELFTVDVEVPLGANPALWDEFNPNLYDLTVTLSATASGRSHCLDKKSVRFGLRELSTQDGYFLVNGRRTLLRGNLECCIFPKTGHPPMDVESWLRIFRIAKTYGLNHFRFHSWCPPEAAFHAADQTGMMLQIEDDVWTKLGDDAQLGQFIYDESKRILDTYGNHPSFCMLVVGNEPSGDHHKEFLSKIVFEWKSLDPRRLYSGTSAYPVLPENDYHVLAGNNDTPIRLQGGPLQPGTDFDYRAATTGCPVPIVAHELGQWCVYPSYSEIQKYTGVVRAKNLEAFRDSLAAHHMLDQAATFARASGALQTLMYRADVEAILRTPNIGGYQLLELQDFPGQGTALVGFLDAFWDAKEGVTPELLRPFCGETVPLLRTKKFTWTASETFSAEMEIAHFGKAPLENAVPVWTLTYADGTVFASGEAPARTIAQGSGIPLGAISVPLTSVKTPARLDVTVSVKNTAFANHWSIWVYPDKVQTAAPKNILVTERIDENAIAALARGGKVVCVAGGQLQKSVKTSFEPTFWNATLFTGQGRHLGILCDPNHPVFTAFPTDSHTDWQWWDLLRGAHAIALDDQPATFRPTIQVIDNWTTNHRLGCLLEARVGTGKLLVCSLNLGARNATATPAQRQMWSSLLAYAASDRFAPTAAMDAESLRKTFGERPQYAGVRIVSADSQAAGFLGANAVDGDPATIWHTEFGAREPKHPHEIQLALPAKKTVHGISYLPRQDMSNGWIADYEVYVSDDGKAWGKPVAKGSFPKSSDLQQVRLEKPFEASYVRLVALSEANGQAFTSIAEIGVF
ncbi:MAG: discoidin domain-containing protein [Candidatus Hydrogenedentes bacterium]|nr:discoidin domain-containing protein [Candidatus Hydrogenedentota bacterium]